MPHDVMKQIQQQKLNVQESGNSVLANSLEKIQQQARNSTEDLNTLNVIVNTLTLSGNNLSDSLDKVVYYFEKYKSASRQATESTNVFKNSYEGIGTKSGTELRKLTQSLQQVKSLQTELGSNFKFSATDNIVLLTRQISKLKNSLKNIGDIQLNISNKNIPKFETGGKVVGGPSSGDKILARLNAGEYVFNRRQMSNLGRLLGKDKQLSNEQVFKLAGGKPVVRKSDEIPKFATGGQIEQRRRRYMTHYQMNRQRYDTSKDLLIKWSNAIQNRNKQPDVANKQVYQEQADLLRELRKKYQSLSEEKRRMIKIDSANLDSFEGIQKEINRIEQLEQQYELLNEEVNKFSSQNAKNLQQKANVFAMQAKALPEGSKQRKEKQRKVKQYSLAANVSQQVQKSGNKTAQKRFEMLNQQLNKATDSKQMQRIVSLMKELNTEIERGQIKVSGFQNVLGGMRKEAEKMSKQFDQFFGGTPVGLAAVAAGFMLIGQQIKKVSDSLADSFVSMSKMNIQMDVLKRTSENAFGSSGMIQNFRNQFNLTREQVGKLAPQMTRFVTQGNKSFTILNSLANNLKDSLGELDISTFEKMMSLMKQLPEKQIQVLMGVNTDSLDKMNTYANLMKNGKISETLQIYQKGGFGEVEGFQGLSQGDKQVVKEQRDIKRQLEDIKHQLYDFLPDFAKTGAVQIAKWGGLLASVASIGMGVVKFGMALKVISSRIVGQVPTSSQVFNVQDVGDNGNPLNPNGNQSVKPQSLGKTFGKIFGKSGVKFGRFITKTFSKVTGVLGKFGGVLGKVGGILGNFGNVLGVVGGGVTGVISGITSALQISQQQKEKNRKEEEGYKNQIKYQEEKNQKSLQHKLKTGGALTMKDFSLDEESQKERLKLQNQKNKNRSGETGGAIGGNIGGVVGGLAGAAIGGAIGSVIPFIGTSIGAAIGGWLGGKGGAMLGNMIGTFVGESVAEEDKELKMPETTKNMIKIANGIFQKVEETEKQNRKRVVNDLKQLRGIQAVLKQIKNDSLTAIYTQNMQATKNQLNTMKLLGGNQAAFSALKEGMVRNASGKLETKLNTLNKQFEQINKKNMSYQARQVAYNQLQIQRGNAISEFVQVVKESTAQYQSIPQVILNGIKQKINSLNKDFATKGMVGTISDTNTYTTENLNLALESMKTVDEQFRKDNQIVSEMITQFKKQQKSALNSLGDVSKQYIGKNDEIDYNKVTEDLRESDQFINSTNKEYQNKKLSGMDFVKQQFSKDIREYLSETKLDIDEINENSSEKDFELYYQQNLDFLDQNIKKLQDSLDTSGLDDESKERIEKVLEAMRADRKSALDRMKKYVGEFGEGDEDERKELLDKISSKFRDSRNASKSNLGAASSFVYQAMDPKTRRKMDEAMKKSLALRSVSSRGNVEQLETERKSEMLEKYQKEVQKIQKAMSGIVDALKNNPIVLFYKKQQEIMKESQKYMNIVFGSSYGTTRILEQQIKQWKATQSQIVVQKENLQKAFESTTADSNKESVIKEYEKNNKISMTQQQKEFLELQKNLVIQRKKAFEGNQQAMEEVVNIQGKISKLNQNESVQKLQKDTGVQAFFKMLASSLQGIVDFRKTEESQISSVFNNIRGIQKQYENIKDESNVYGLTKSIQASNAQVELGSYDLDVSKVETSLDRLMEDTVDRYQEQIKQIRIVTEENKKKFEEQIDGLRGTYQEYLKKGDKENANKTLQQIQTLQKQLLNVDEVERKKLAQIELKKKRDVVSFAQKERDLKLKILDYESQSIDIQRDLASSIGAPLQTVLSLEQQSVDMAKKKLEVQQQTLDYMYDNQIKGQALEQQKLRVQKQQAQVVKNSMGAQRSALQKLMGNVFGQFTKFSWMGNSNKAKIFGQGYMETSGGMIVNTGGKYTGGYRQRVANANANGGIDPLTGQSYKAGGEAKRFNFSKDSKTSLNKSEDVKNRVDKMVEDKKNQTDKNNMEIPALKANIKTAEVVEKIYELLKNGLNMELASSVGSNDVKKQKKQKNENPKKDNEQTEQPVKPTTENRTQSSEPQKDISYVDRYNSYVEQGKKMKERHEEAQKELIRSYSKQKVEKMSEHNEQLRSLETERNNELDTHRQYLKKELGEYKSALKLQGVYWQKLKKLKNELKKTKDVDEKEKIEKLVLETSGLYEKVSSVIKDFQQVYSSFGLHKGGGEGNIERFMEHLNKIQDETSKKYDNRKKDLKNRQKTQMTNLDDTYKQAMDKLKAQQADEKQKQSRNEQLEDVAMLGILATNDRYENINLRLPKSKKQILVGQNSIGSIVAMDKQGVSFLNDKDDIDEGSFVSNQALVRSFMTREELEFDRKTEKTLGEPTEKTWGDTRAKKEWHDSRRKKAYQRAMALKRLYQKGLIRVEENSDFVGKFDETPLWKSEEVRKQSKGMLDEFFDIGRVGGDEDVVTNLNPKLISMTENYLRNKGKLKNGETIFLKNDKNGIIKNEIPDKIKELNEEQQDELKKILIPEIEKTMGQTMVVDDSTRAEMMTKRLVDSGRKDYGLSVKDDRRFVVTDAMKKFLVKKEPTTQQKVLAFQGPSGLEAYKQNSKKYMEQYGDEITKWYNQKQLQQKIFAVKGKEGLDEYKKGEEAYMEKYGDEITSTIESMQALKNNGAKFASVDDLYSNINDAINLGRIKDFNNISTTDLANIFGNEQQKKVAQQLSGLDWKNMTRTQRSQMMLHQNKLRASIVQGQSREQMKGKLKSWKQRVYSGEIIQGERHDEGRIEARKQNTKDVARMVQRNSYHYMLATGGKTRDFSQQAEIAKYDPKKYQQIANQYREQRSASMGKSLSSSFAQARSIMKSAFANSPVKMRGLGETISPTSRESGGIVGRNGEQNSRVKVSVDVHFDNEMFTANVKEITQEHSQTIVQRGSSKG